MRSLSERVHLDQRWTIFCLRGVISLLMLFFLAYNPNAEKVSLWIPAFFLAAHLASNVALLWVPAAALETALLQAGVFLFDIAVISGLIYLCEGFDSDLYLIYFVVVLMSGLQMRIWQSLLIGLAACAVYLTLWSKSNPGAELWDPHILLRLPFFYIVAVFAAFFAHQAREREERLKEAALDEERAKLRTVFGQMQDAAILTDDQGLIVLCNEAARQFFSIADPPRGSLGDHLAPMKVTPPMARLLSSSDPSLAFEAVREEPKKLVLAGAATVLKFEAVESKSAWQGHLFVCRDVTAERQEELLKRSFLFLISHKLKTPLASVTGFAQFLLTDRDPAPEAAARRDKAINNILVQGNKLSGLIEKLLDFIAIEALAPERLDRRAFRLANAVRQAKKTLDPWLEEHAAVVELEVDPALEAYGDEALIQRTIKNLIENGVKFNTKPKKSMLVRASTQDGVVSVSVADQGDGIPPEDRQKVFQKFHQVEPSFTGNVEGWGLGLPFVKKVVEYHGGRLTIESRLGEGTTVSFTLPRP